MQVLRSCETCRFPQCSECEDRNLRASKISIGIKKIHLDDFETAKTIIHEKVREFGIVNVADRLFDYKVFNWIGHETLNENCQCLACRLENELFKIMAQDAACRIDNKLNSYIVVNQFNGG